jgi:hypothetical protein
VQSLLNCTLKKSAETSHIDILVQVSKAVMEKENVTAEEIRFIEHEVATGVQPDMKKHGRGKDKWPKLFKKIFSLSTMQSRLNFKDVNSSRVCPFPHFSSGMSKQVGWKS